MNNINNSQNKRMLARAGNLNLKYFNNTISSSDFAETATTYEQTYISNLIANTNINTTMKIVDYKIDMDGRIIVIGEGGEVVVTEFYIGSGFDDTIYSLQQTTDGGYLVGGYFTSYSGQTANYIIKLKPDGSIDDTFNSGDGFNDYVYSLLQTTDGDYLVGGSFASYSGQTANSIIKLKSDGTSITISE